MSTKIAWLQPIWSHYHIARAKAFQKNNPDMDLVCLAISDICGEVNASDWLVKDFCNLNHVVLFPGMAYLDLKPLQITKAVIEFVIKNKINVLCLLGYSKREIQQIAIGLRLIKPKLSLILFSESKKDDFPRYWWKEKYKTKLLKCYNTALVAGNIHKDYLMELGMNSDAIFLGYDVVENHTFNPNQIKKLPKPINDNYFFTVNRFIPRKNILLIVSAYAAYKQKMGSLAWDLVLCGDGELRPQIEQKIAELNLQDVVHLPGFLQQKQLLPYFAHASCFIHGSITEQWGLVVNEAMAAGLPVLVSKTCGCFEELVIEGFNGFGFNPHNIEQLTELMIDISQDNFNLEQLRNNALKHIQKFSPDYFATGLKQAINNAISYEYR